MRIRKQRPSKQFTDAYLNFIRPHDMANSWLDDERYSAKQYDPEAPFIGKAVGPGMSIELTFKSIMDKVRADDTKIGNPGETYFEFFFEDANGKERTIEQNSPKGAFFRAMRTAQVAEGEKIRLSRTGEGYETSWTIEKFEGGEFKKAEGSAIPF